MTPEFEQWLRQQIMDHGRDLAVIKDQTTKTNGKVEKHDTRIDSLEASRDKQSGFVKGVYWLWALLIALAGIFGIHLAVGK